MFQNPPLKDIRLQLTKTQHIVCQARINGIKAKLLIDTGASNSCIALSEQERFGLIVEGEQFEAAGAGEGKMKAIPSQQSPLILGRHAVGAFSFILLEMQHINASLKSQRTDPIDGILGADFLKQKKAVIDYKKMRLVINA